MSATTVSPFKQAADRMVELLDAGESVTLCHLAGSLAWVETVRPVEVSESLPAVPMREVHVDGTTVPVALFDGHYRIFDSDVERFTPEEAWGQMALHRSFGPWPQRRT